MGIAQEGRHRSTQDGSPPGGGPRPSPALDEAHLPVIGESDAFLILMATLRRVARRSSNVLLLGESGSGKGVCARLLHDVSARKGKPFVKVVCGALPETLIDSELFGHERGAFTGAEAAKPGKFELAQGGSIFLDEIGDLSLSIQMKLLRVLEDREFERLGGIRTLHSDARVIAATHRDLKALIAEGKFRADLYYRLTPITVHVPSLRDRPGDVPLLAQAFLKELADGQGSSLPEITPQVVAILKEYAWPGNVRELRNAIERMLAFDDDGRLHVDDVPPELCCAPPCRRTPGTGNLGEKERILIALEENATVAEAARAYGVSTSYFYRLMRKHGIKPRA
jgi:transcriptional regulator with PAS, ATPase and Fis domain